MRYVSRSLLTISLVLWSSLGQNVFAQETDVLTATLSQPTPRITKEEVDQRLESVQANGELAEETKTELIKRFKSVQEWLKNADEASSRAAAFRADIQKLPEVLAKAKLELAQPVKDATVTVPPAATLTQIEHLASESEASFKAAQELLARKEEEVQRRGERKTEVARLIEETKQRLEETRQQQMSPAPEEPAELVDARRLELAARLKALESQATLYKAEAARLEAVAELLPLSRDIAKREKNLREKESGTWQKIVENQRQRESEGQAAEARRQVQNAHPALRSLAERNAALAEERQSLAASIARTSQQVKAVNKQIEELEQQFQKAEQRVRRAGHSTTVGLMLRRQSEELPGERECDLRLRKIEDDMPRANLALIEIEEERESLGDIEACLPQVLASLNSPIEGHSAEHLEPTVRELLQTKLDLLGSLATDYDSYLEDLSELELSNSKLAGQIRKSRNYIGEHVLWIRSAQPLWKEDVSLAAGGLAAIAAPEPWFELAQHCGLDTIQRPLAALAVLLVVGLIVVFHARLRARMAVLCSTSTAGTCLRFRPTVEAIFLAAVVATEWPLLLAYLGWRMSSADAAQDLTQALGLTLQYAAVLMWVSDFVKHVLRASGLAESHFGWSSFSTRLVRNKLRWLTAIGIPLAIITVSMEHYQDGEWSKSLGRMAFVAGMLLLARFMHSILNSKENILRTAILLDTGNWFARVRAISHALGVCVPCLLAILAVAGYYYSAQQVALRWQATLAVTLVLLFGYSVAARWCLVKRRNLAMRQARDRRREMAGGTMSPDQSVSPAAIKIEDQQPDLSAIHEQLRYLLRHAVTVGMIVASWFIWADVLPALKVLDRVVLWEQMVEVSEIHETPDGKLVQTSEQKPVTTTLRHALFACLLVVATVIIGRNLPALLEITVLQRMPFDKGGRHAISVVLKYTVALSGLFLACRTMSFTWSSVQWLAAGMTVGLGFGLQEIFANFVSGLILLLERPIRVGDVVTLGDVTGSVTSIRIRATTITNWDRKELIVPNKDLITGRLLNWTLTDTTNRIVITVGVAYRSDPQRARDLILAAVSSHPNVLEDPAPRVTLEEFADSALNIVVRAYLASMDTRLATTHDLHVAIHRSLQEAGIEIAFPQRDINVRQVESALLPAAVGDERKAA